MQKVLALTLLLVAVVGLASASAELKNKKHYSTESEMQALFKEFESKYGKEYEHDQARQNRFEVFKNNLKKIDMMNKADPSGVYSVNEFTDLTEEEFQRLRQSNYAEAENLMNGQETQDVTSVDSSLELSDDDLVPEASEVEDGTEEYEWDFDDDVAENDSEISDEQDASEEVGDRDTDGYTDEFEKFVHLGDEVKAPANFDWRDQKAVTHPKNQLHCGSCWAFAAVGNLEGLMKIHQGKLQSLSEQNLVDCDHENHGCHGGIPSRAFKFVIKKGGLIKEDAYPYKASVGQCQMKPAGLVAGADKDLRDGVDVDDRDVDYGPNFVKVNVKGWTKVPQNEDAMVKYLYKHGPLAAAMHGHGWLHFYHSGIANPPNCPMNLTHGIVIVGYGVENGKKYWVIKNSWGPLYGEKGFFRLARGSNVCNISKMVSTALVA